MAISIIDFWKLAVSSGLFARERCAELNAAFVKAHGEKQPADGQALAEWLVAQRLLTRYQATVLASGAPGPFLFGDYKLYERISRGRLSGLFRATHLPSGTSRLLMFFSGPATKDAAQWSTISRQIEQARAAQDPHLSNVVEFVVSTKFKFAAIEDLPSETATRPTPQTSAEVQAVCRLGCDVAQALACLHRHGMVHGDVRPADVWIREDGTAKLLQYPLSRWPSGLTGPATSAPDYRAPELDQPGRQPDATSDIYGLGCTLYEWMTGHPPFAGGDATQKARRHAREIPAQLAGVTPVAPALSELVARMIQKDPAGRPSDAGQVAAALERIVGAPTATLAEPRTPQARVQDRKDLTPAAPLAAFAPSIEIVPREGHTVIAKEKSSDRQRTGNGRWIPLTVMAVAASVALLAWGYYAWQRREPASSLATASDPAIKTVSGSPSAQTVEASTNKTQANPMPTSGDEEPAQATPIARPQRTIVEVDDDGQSLWASPTEGEPLDLRYLPVGAQVVLVLRPAEILQSAEGSKVLAALGPAGPEARRALEAAIAVPLEQIEQLVVAVYPSETDQPQLAFQVRLVKPMTLEALMVAWRRPRSQQLEERTIYTGSTWSFYIPPEHENRVFSVAPPRLMLEPFMTDGPPSLRKLLAVSDQLRELTLLFAPSYLLTDAKAFSMGTLAQLKAPLIDFLGPHAQGVMFSAQLSDDLFLELRVQGSLDKVPQQLAREYKEHLGALPNAVEAFVLALGPHPHDQLLLSRFPRMLQLMENYTRAGTDEGQAVLRCYLPGRAGHNLLLGAELALYEQSQAPARPASATESPRAVRAATALNRRISLSFPLDTLERSLQMFSQEAGVAIEIQGRDLQAEGITRNQQFSLDERDQPAGEILRRILKLANPQGKLVYVVKSKPGGGDVIWITTRAAAASRGDRLPAELEATP